MFGTILSNIAVILAYMLIGYILCKSKVAVASHAKSMSSLLIYILGPAMIVYSFLQMEYSIHSWYKILIYFLVTLAVQILFLALMYVIFSRKYEDAKYRIMSAAAVLGNVGFFGMPVISRIFPDEPIVICYSSVNVMSMNLIVFTIGVFLITNDKKYMSIKSAILNPTSIGMIISLPLFFLDVQLPEIAMDAVTLLARMATPMGMFILGIRLSTVDLKNLFTRPFVYLTCVLKLLAFPVFAYACVFFLPFLDNVAKQTVFILAAAPSGVIIESLSELHECEQELSANVVLLTTILCILTMPFIVSLLAMMF